MTLRWRTKIAVAVVVVLSICAITLIATIGICSRTAERTHYRVVLAKIEIGSRVTAAITALEAAGCYELAQHEQKVRYECVPITCPACRNAPIMVEVVDLYHDRGIVSLVEVNDAVSLFGSLDTLWIDSDQGAA